MSEFPEHEKLRKVAKESQTIGEFLEWLQDEKDFHLAEYKRFEGYVDHQLVVSMRSRKSLLAEFFEIDLNKIETEKRAMLDELRKLNEAS